MSGLMSVPLIRSLTWRLGRKLYCIARREGTNSPERNGEYWLLQQVLMTTAAPDMILMDIGANIGDWTARATAELGRQGGVWHVHAFEPAASTFSGLSNRFENASNVACHNMAISDSNGEATFFVVGAHAGTNSLIKAEGAITENVRTMTFDSFIQEQNIGHVELVKTDTEGYDFHVMKGADQSLRLGKIDVWQFEYNHRWISSSSSLKDVFDFIADKPYSLGKLYGNGIELYPQWNQQLDRYFETNMVLIRHHCKLESICKRYVFNASNTLESA